MRVLSGCVGVLLLVFMLAITVGCGSKKAVERSAERSTGAKESAENKAKDTAQSSQSEENNGDGGEKQQIGEVLAAGYFGDALSIKDDTGRARLKGSEKQSVFLVIIDALNVKNLSAYGYRRPTSPTLEAVAQRGVRFVNHISNSSWTRPSFTTIITGLNKSEHKVELSSRNLGEKIETLAERFRGAGYATAAFVGNPLVRKLWGFGQGFETYKDTKDYEKVFPPDSRVADDAIQWIEGRGEKPFFLMVFLTAPHTPYRPPAGARRFLDEVPEGKVIEYPFREYKRGLAEDDHERIVAAYDDEIAYTDAQLKRILDKIEEKGVQDEVAVVVTADHGEVFGLHNCYTHTYHMWEPALRVPLLIASNRLEKKGITDTRITTHVDLTPTLLNLAGIQDDYDGDGVSVFEPNDKAESGGRMIYSQYNAHGIRRQAIRRGGWKLVHHDEVKESSLERLNSLHQGIPHADPKDLPSISVGKERYELYDLREDPREQKDLYAESASLAEVQALETELGLRIGKISSDVPQLSEETLQALEAAGYISRSPK